MQNPIPGMRHMMKPLARLHVGSVCYVDLLLFLLVRNWELHHNIIPICKIWINCCETTSIYDICFYPILCHQHLSCIACACVEWSSYCGIFMIVRVKHTILTCLLFCGEGIATLYLLRTHVHQDKSNTSKCWMCFVLLF